MNTARHPPFANSLNNFKLFLGLYFAAKQGVAAKGGKETRPFLFAVLELLEKVRHSHLPRVFRDGRFLPYGNDPVRHGDSRTHNEACFISLR